MAASLLASANPHLAIHLSDRTLTPIISSSSSASEISSSASSTSSSTTTPTNAVTTQSQALSSLTATAITAYDTASRLQLGQPQRILVSTTANGPVILHSYLNPTSSLSVAQLCSRTERSIVDAARDDLRPLTATTIGSDGENGQEEDGTLVNGGGSVADVKSDVEEEFPTNNAPLLIGTVVAPTSEDMTDARRTAARLEKVGIEFQRVWSREQDESREPGGVGGSEHDG